MSLLVVRLIGSQSQANVGRQGPRRHGTMRLAVREF